MEFDMVADKELAKLADMVEGPNFFDPNLTRRLACLLSFASLFTNDCPPIAQLLPNCSPTFAQLLHNFYPTIAYYNCPLH